MSGETLRLERGAGRTIPGLDEATLDFDHPLAGETPLFEVEILEIR